jgi:hypothetical protein
MKMPMKRLFPLVIGTLCTSMAAAGPIGSDDSITIYSGMQAGAVSPELFRPVSGRSFGGQVPGYAIIRHDRVYEIGKGVHALRVADVAALIDPTTVTFSSLDEPRTRVLEQSFQFDLVSQAKLLQRYLGERITVEQSRGDHVDLIEGILLGSGDGLTLQLDDGSVQAIQNYGNLRFSELPGGLITRPTLEWLLDSPSRGSQDTRITYETGGMTWWADYNVIYDETAECSMDLSAWVSIINQSGAAYENALQDGHGRRFRRFCREIVFRVPPLHAGKANQPARQLDETDRVDEYRARHSMPEGTGLRAHPEYAVLRPSSTGAGVWT